MGMLALSRLMPVKRRRRTQAAAYCTTEDGSTASTARRKSTPTSSRHCRNSAGAIAKRRRSYLTLDRLPQDLLHQIFALLPMQDAARAGCASRQLLWSWKHYPELEFSARTLQLDGHHAGVRDQVAKDIIRRIDAALQNQNRSGICVKRLRFELQFLPKVRAGTINRWLDAAAALGIDELTLDLPLGDGKLKYRFPSELFFGEKGRCSIQSLCLSACSFSPGHGSCSFGSSKRVGFSWVRITTEESCLFLSNSPALERLELEYCHEIARLRIPSTLRLLVSLRVGHCKMLRSIETHDAPSLSIFHYHGPVIQFSLEEALQLRDVNMSIYPCFNLFDYVLKELPKLGPNLETLSLMSADEIGYMYPLKIVLREEFVHLKHLELAIVGPWNLSTFRSQFHFVVTFLSACPVLETFTLRMEDSPLQMRLEDIDPSRLPTHCHQIFKLVMDTGFRPDLTELFYYILNNVASLRCLTLDYRIQGFEKVLVAHIAQDTGAVIIKGCGGTFVTSKDSTTLHEEA